MLPMVVINVVLTGKNVVVCDGGYRVKLIDFSTARKVHDAIPLTIGYTSIFAAPEVITMQYCLLLHFCCIFVRLMQGSVPHLVLIFGPSCV